MSHSRPTYHLLRAPSRSGAPSISDLKGALGGTLRVRDIEIAPEALPTSGRRRVLKVGMAVDTARGERWDNVYFNLEELSPRMARDPDTRRIVATAIAAALDDEPEVSRGTRKHADGVPTPASCGVVRMPKEGLITARMGRSARWRPVLAGSCRSQPSGLNFGAGLADCHTSDRTNPGVPCTRHSQSQMEELRLVK
jgi:hypothetical protein